MFRSCSVCKIVLPERDVLWVRQGNVHFSLCSSRCSSTFASEYKCGCGETRDPEDMITIQGRRYCLGNRPPGCFNNKYVARFPDCDICLNYRSPPGFLKSNANFAVCEDCVQVMQQRRHQEFCTWTGDCACESLIDLEEKEQWNTIYMKELQEVFPGMYEHLKWPMDLLPLLLSFLVSNKDGVM
jgi:hypothetical protein